MNADSPNTNERNSLREDVALQRCEASRTADSELALKLWFNRRYDRFEAETLSEDSELGWF